MNYIRYIANWRADCPASDNRTSWRLGAAAMFPLRLERLRWVFELLRVYVGSCFGGDFLWLGEGSPIPSNVIEPLIVEDVDLQVQPLPEMVERLGLRLAGKVSPLGRGLGIRPADAVYQVPSLTYPERHTLLLGNVPIEYAEVDLLFFVVRADGLWNIFHCWNIGHLPSVVHELPATDSNPSIVLNRL